ncbi:conserved Plasmodium membrane [Babesia ovata]|uniref:Conserved Plasmodium membrane n=1 Tax=Babesia ovata TaxID=189622 RepID=A0A2H6K970_9APIC|nr:conserved Plasmodium membrane [Babesia ovata]GBE59499.1 conserved Plasmodium membrane [Babesia ovata]
MKQWIWGKVNELGEKAVDSVVNIVLSRNDKTISDFKQANITSSLDAAEPGPRLALAHVGLIDSTFLCHSPSTANATSPVASHSGRAPREQRGQIHFDGLGSIPTHMCRYRVSLSCNGRVARSPSAEMTDSRVNRVCWNHQVLMDIDDLWVDLNLVVQAEIDFNQFSKQQSKYNGSGTSTSSKRSSGSRSSRSRHITRGKAVDTDTAETQRIESIYGKTRYKQRIGRALIPLPLLLDSLQLRRTTCLVHDQEYTAVGQRGSFATSTAVEHSSESTPVSERGASFDASLREQVAHGDGTPRDPVWSTASSISNSGQYGTETLHDDQPTYYDAELEETSGSEEGGSSEMRGYNYGFNANSWEHADGNAAIIREPAGDPTARLKAYSIGESYVNTSTFDGAGYTSGRSAMSPHAYDTAAWGNGYNASPGHLDRRYTEAGDIVRRDLSTDYTPERRASVPTALRGSKQSGVNASMSMTLNREFENSSWEPAENALRTDVYSFGGPGDTVESQPLSAAPTRLITSSEYAYSEVGSRSWDRQGSGSNVSEDVLKEYRYFADAEMTLQLMPFNEHKFEDNKFVRPIEGYTSYGMKSPTQPLGYIRVKIRLYFKRRPQLLALRNCLRPPRMYWHVPQEFEMVHLSLIFKRLAFFIDTKPRWIDYILLPMEPYNHIWYAVIFWVIVFDLMVFAPLPRAVVDLYLMTGVISCFYWRCLKPMRYDLGDRTFAAKGASDSKTNAGRAHRKASSSLYHLAYDDVKQRGAHGDETTSVSMRVRELHNPPSFTSTSTHTESASQPLVHHPKLHSIWNLRGMEESSSRLITPFGTRQLSLQRYPGAHQWALFADDLSDTNLEELVKFGLMMLQRGQVIFGYIVLTLDKLRASLSCTDSLSCMMTWVAIGLLFIPIYGLAYLVWLVPPVMRRLGLYCAAAVYCWTFHSSTSFNVWGIILRVFAWIRSRRVSKFLAHWYLRAPDSREVDHRAIATLQLTKH